MKTEDYKTVLENLSKNRGRNQFRSEVESVLNKSPKPTRAFATTLEGVVTNYAKASSPSHSPCAMNRWEARYAEYLSTLRAAGEVKWFGFECLKLRLAKATYYTPDFLVVPKEGPWECHEVKGFWREDARVKFKVAVEAFPFVFVVVRLSEGRWISERF